MRPNFPTYLPIYETYFSYLSTYIWDLFSYLSTYIWNLIFLPIYLNMRPIFLQNWLPRWNQRLTHTNTYTQCSKFWAKMECLWSRLQNAQTQRVLCLVSMDQICGWRRRRVPTRMESKKTTGYCTLSIFELGKGNLIGHHHLQYATSTSTWICLKVCA